MPIHNRHYRGDLLRPDGRYRGKSANGDDAVRLEEVQRFRAGLIYLVFVVAFILVAARAVFLTTVRHDEMIREAHDRHDTAIELTRPRGDILDRHQEQIATVIEVESIAADPKLIENPAATAVVLAEVLELNGAEVLEKLRLEDRRFVWIKRLITPEQSAELDKRDPALLRGVGRVKENRRRYPFGRLAAAVVGFTDIDTKGLEGLEKMHDKLLAGVPGRIVAIRDAKGRTFLPEGVQIVGREDGASLRLTIDAKIQWFAEDALDSVMEEFRPKHAWAIVMDVRTGEILAMANRPTFNPTHAGRYSADSHRNRAILDLYEPGSTMKPLTVAMVLADGKVSLDEQIFCQNGAFKYGGHVIHDTHPYGNLTPAGIVGKSSNIGVSKLALRLGKKPLYDWMRRFGFGQRTGIDHPAEAAGRLRNWETWYPIDICTHAYGQGISVSALQLLTATAALGNGGRLMRPYIVADVIGADGQVLEHHNPRIVRRVVSENVADTVLGMMRTVTETGGTGTRAALGNFPVAGKTGTAWKVNPRTKTYDRTRLVGSFVGLVPGDDPRIGIIVVVDEPAGSGYGGIVAAPAFRSIAERTLDYLGVFSHDQSEERRLIAEIEKHMNGEDKPAPAATAPMQRVLGEGSAPNFLGLTMRSAMRLAESTGVPISLRGTGVAVKQDPAPGQELAGKEGVVVEFAPRNS